jgi:mono/diheme cytochrome c family protein
MSDESKETISEPSEAPLHGLVAEYKTPQALMKAAEKVRDAGFKNWDTYTPFPIHGIDPAMGIKPTILPWIVLCGGLTGCATALLLQWYTNAYDYKFIVSGKPFWSIPANIPVTFELTVLFSAFAAFLGMLGLNKLPHPSHSLDRVKRFARGTQDRFFVMIQASDPLFDEKDTTQLLQNSGAVAVEAVPEDTTSRADMPRGILYALLILASAATIPFSLAAYARESKSSNPRINIIPDMDFQKKFKTQRANPFFEDGRAMRPEIEGTIPHGQLNDDDHLHRGKVGGAWARTFPSSLPATEQTMARGRERFGIYCAPCHGQIGEGDGMVSIRATKLAEGTWVPPSNMTEERLRYQPVGELFNTITNGIRNMPAYGRQITAEDRWAIVLYVRALQRSRAATIQDVPEVARGLLK